MKKIIAVMLVILFSPSPAAEALFGGGLKGPLPVYNTDKSVDAATIATQVNTAKQLAADLANLKKMDKATAARNAKLIYERIQKLIELQKQNDTMISDYEQSQTRWNEQYNTGESGEMSGAEYAEKARQLRESLDTSLYAAMQTQGYVIQNEDSSAALQQLLDSSENAEGALAAAQVGNQIAAMQAQQMMLFQAMVAQSNQAQAEWMRYQIEKENMEQEKAEEYFKDPPEPKKGQGPGFRNFE